MTEKRQPGMNLTQRQNLVLTPQWRARVGAEEKTDKPGLVIPPKRKPRGKRKAKTTAAKLG